MPKAQATFSQEDEEEKTTIESGWEDEASTTVEQGEVADRIRSIEALKPPVHGGANGAPRSNTNITSTNGGALDEPTVDDQRANLLITPSIAPARVVVIAGNDKGQELEIRPGKAYSIGRAIDNDVVLTDIAVSRKHFELRYEDGKWSLVDLKSGNGTVVNGAIEDGPFVLMNGDTIEIGNTQFRFDHANQPARVRNSAFTMELDEEESSTVAGKPLRDDVPSPAQLMQPRAQLPRPKTVPPPAPVARPRSPSVLPAGPQPIGYMGVNAQGSLPPASSVAPQRPNGGPIGVPMAAHNAPTMSPLAQMPAMHAPMGHPPAILGENGVVRPQLLRSAHEGMVPLPGVMPTTIPGQGPPVAPSQPQLPYGYPGVGDMQPQLAQLQINGTVPRDATSTALVQPTPYGMHPAAAFSVAQPQRRMTRKLQLALGAALLMVLAAIATIAIIKSRGGDDDKPAPSASEKADPATTPDPSSAAPEAKQPTVVPIAQPDDTEAKKAEEQRKAEDAAKKAEEQRKAEAAAKKAEEEQRKAEDAAKKAEEQRKAEAAAKKAEDEQRKAEARREEQRRAEERREEQRRAEERRRAEQQRSRTRTTTRSTSSSSRPTRVATASSADVSAAKEKAESLYRAKKFNDAVSVLRKAAGDADESDAKRLRSTAASYEQVGRAYNVGTAPSTPVVEAYVNLQKALNYENQIGIHAGEIKSRLAQVAPRAAVKYMSEKSFESAFRAVRVAEANGGANSSTKSVRDALAEVANELYRQAMAEKSLNPSAARAKLQRIKAIIDRVPVLAQAEKALRDLPR